MDKTEIDKRVDLDIVENLVDLIKKDIPDWTYEKEMEFRKECYNQQECIEDFIEEHGVSAIVKEMELSDILDNFTSDEIMWELDEDEMARYLDDHNYDFSEYIDDEEEDEESEEIGLSKYSINYLLQLIGNKLSSRNFLTKEDLKERICNYIDDLPNTCIDVRL